MGKQVTYTTVDFDYGSMVWFRDDIRVLDKDKDPFPSKIIVRDKVTTVIWKNGDKTTVRCMDGQTYSEYDAIVQAYFKYKMGSTKKRARWMKAAMNKIQYHGEQAH